MKRCRHMHAAILAAQGQPLVIDTVEMPQTLACGQVLVRVLYSGICGSQLGEIDGVKGPDRYLPHLLGHEGSGVVEALGEGVTTVAVGDPVVLHWRPGAGIAAAPPVYRWRDRSLNAGWVTTFNQRAVVAENRVTRVPDDFDLALAPLLGCAVTTGLGVVENDAHLKSGEAIVILGTGGVGLSIVQAAVLVSAHPIVAVDRYPDRLELARRLGATHTICAAAEAAGAAVRDLVGGQGAEVVVDNTGLPAVIAAAYRLTAPRGRTVLVGVPRHDADVTLHTLPLHFGRVLTGSHGGSARPAADIPRLVRLWRAGRLDLGALVSDRFPLEEINTAIDRMRRGQIAGRCLIEMPD